jgi:ribosome-binding ATPase YchF (GTP1/OBG family)
VPEAAALEERLDTAHARPGCRVVALCGRLEMELTQLEDETAETWRSEFGLSESGLDRVIRASYDLLGLVTFFTTTSSEVRAWPVPGGTLAPPAAGRVHTDMERGFIRAEVIGLDDLLACGSFTEARKKGLLRHEGRTYTVQDGDVITFLFNV